MDKYIIVEQNEKFHIEELKKFLFWKWYSPIGWMDLVGGGVYYFLSFEDAQKHLDKIQKKVHKINWEKNYKNKK